GTLKRFTTTYCKSKDRAANFTSLATQDMPKGRGKKATKATQRRKGRGGKIAEIPPPKTPGAWLPSHFNNSAQSDSSASPHMGGTMPQIHYNKSVTPVTMASSGSPFMWGATMTGSARPYMGGTTMTGSARPYMGGTTMTSSSSPHMGGATMTGSARPYMGGTTMTSSSSPHMGGATMTGSARPYMGGTTMTSSSSPHMGGATMTGSARPYMGGTTMTSSAIPYMSGVAMASSGNSTSATGMSPSFPSVGTYTITLLENCHSKVSVCYGCRQQFARNQIPADLVIVTKMRREFTSPKDGSQQVNKVPSNVYFHCHPDCDSVYKGSSHTFCHI
ncbi:hypothetical protein AC249_AIPGENE18718, partial [Exaiptasia diaphana]